MSGASHLVLDGDEEEGRREPWSADLRRVGGLALVTVVLAASVGPLSLAPTTESASLSWPSGCVPRGAASPTGSMTLARSGHTATLLRSGRVLVAGGWISQNSPNVTSSAELYDPDNGIWTATGSMNVARAFHAAVMLPSGKVLVMGGWAPNSTGAGFASLASAELYDPETGRWTETGSMHAGRDSFPAVVLRSGRVFVFGGGIGGWRGAELYSPGSGTWSAVGGEIFGWYGTATLLPSDKVLVAGGSHAAELFDPATNAWRPAGVMSTGRYWHTATLLPSGMVLVAGGDSIGPGELTASAELYDPGKSSWATTTTMTSPHAGADAILLASGKVLVAGGGRIPEKSWADDNVDLFDPVTARWTALGVMTTVRSFFTATPLRSGTLLFAGGETSNGVPYASAEIYELTCAPPH